MASEHFSFPKNIHPFCHNRKIWKYFLWCVVFRIIGHTSFELHELTNPYNVVFFSFFVSLLFGFRLKPLPEPNHRIYVGLSVLCMVYCRLCVYVVLRYVSNGKILWLIVEASSSISVTKLRLLLRIYYEGQVASGADVRRVTKSRWTVLIRLFESQYLFNPLVFDWWRLVPSHYPNLLE